MQHSADLDTYISPNMVLMKIKVNKAGEVLNAKIMHTFSEEYSADVVSVAEKFPIMQPAVCHGRAVSLIRLSNYISNRSDRLQYFAFALLCGR